MKLYVMRHGPAEDSSATGYDEDRALTTTGRDRVRSVIELLVREAELPGCVLASPLVRAQQTADIVSAASTRAGRRDTTETVADLAPGGKSLDLVRRLAQGAAADSMLVGHEPDLSRLVERLLEGEMPMPMDKAMVVALDVPVEGRAALRFIVEPTSATIVHDHR